MVLSITGAKASKWFKNQTNINLGVQYQNMSLSKIQS
jgi:hypothetical protein